MNKKYIYILIGIITIVGLVLPSIVQADYSGSGVTCTPKWMWGHWAWQCDDGLLWFYYEQMSAYYSPPLEEVFVPENTYVYVVGGSTETLSGQ